MSAPTLEYRAAWAGTPRALLAEAHRCAAGLALAHRTPAPRDLTELGTLTRDAANTAARHHHTAAAQYARHARNLALGLIGTPADGDVTATVLDSIAGLLQHALDATQEDQ